MLIFIANVMDDRLIKQDVQQYQEREELLADLFMQMQSPFDLQTMIQAVVTRLRQTLAVDRVLAYQIFPDDSGICMAEAVADQYPVMRGQAFPPECVPPPYLEAYREGRLWVVTDILDEDLADCHKSMLEAFDVRSMMIMAIVSMDAALKPQQRTLWGLLAIHCRSPRFWTTGEQRLLRIIATHLATAIEHTQLLQSLQQRAQELEDRVSERTKSLAQALKFEQLVHQLTETLRQHLDADQVLQAAVEGLTQALNVERCFASLVDSDPDRLTVHYEFVREDIASPLPSLQGQSFSLQNLSACCQDLKQLDRPQRPLYQPPLSKTTLEQRQADCIINSTDQLTADQLTADGRDADQLTTDGWIADAQTADRRTADLTQLLAAACSTSSAIRDDQGLLGLLTVCCGQARLFEPDEITLIEQVANQCAIALRQAQLQAQKHDLRVSADYFRSFLETSTDVFIEYDSQLRCLSVNPAGSTLLGLAPEAIIGKTNRDLFGEAAEQLDSTIQRAFEIGEKIFVVHELLLEQSHRIFETVYTPIKTSSGAVRRVIGVSRDVTELKQQWQLLETQNQQLAENTRVKQEFITTTSHELRTPLTAVLGFSNVLLQGFFGTLNPKQTDYVERIHDSGQHLLDLINDILDLSRLEADRLELDCQAIFVPDVCEGVISLIRERALNQGLKLNVDLDPSIDWIVADPRRLKQMLLNLLANAVKFTQEGTVGLKVYRQPLPLCADGPIATEVLEDNGSGDRASEMIRFLVWDTGIGIDPVSQQKLFSPFSQIDSSLARNQHGSGLGLVITRKLAELHSGTVTLESAPNQGARFTIALPFHPTN